MNQHHAQASSEGPNESSGKSRGSFRGVSANSGVSVGVDGRGAPSGRRRRVSLVFAATAALVLLLGVSGASAAAPIVTVNNASSVEYTTAHVSGEVDPQAQPTTYRFQYVDQGTREFELGFGFSEWEFAETGAEGTIEGGAQAVEADLAGLATNTTYYLRLVAENAEGSSEAVPASTFTTKAVPVPTVSIEGPTAVTGTTAHFTGHIEPNAPAGNPAAFDVNWQFSCNPECPGLSGGHITADSSTHTVEADATGLLPGTAYEVTLSASNAGGTATAGPETFSTPAIAPQVVSTQVSALYTEATLAAQINPGGLQTTYHFEYGPTSSYGQSTSPATIPAGSTPVSVEAGIMGLSPASEYHYRVVAENSIETVDSADQTFSTQSRPVSGEACPNEADRTDLAALLPDCRAYEQVSPVEKHGFEAGIVAGAQRYGLAATDGNHVLFQSHGPMGEATIGLQEYSLGTRGPNGWTVKPAVPAPEGERINSEINAPIQLVPSSDMTKMFFASVAPYLSEVQIADTENGGSQFGGTAFYLTHDGKLEWVTRPQIPNPEPAPGNIGSPELHSVGGSPDLSKVYFWGLPTLLPSDAARAAEPAAHWGLYEYSEGTLRSAGTLPDGSESPGGAAVTSAERQELHKAFNDDSSAEQSAGNEVSSDGSTLFFVSPDPGTIAPNTQPLTQLYVRRGGHSTLVSHTPAGAPAPNGADYVHTLEGGAEKVGVGTQYVFASPDGSTAYFYSTDALAAGAPADESLKTYRYDVASNTVSYLANVGEVFAISDDGQRFMFTDVNGFTQHGIYVWDRGTIKTVTSQGVRELAPARATPSGSVFVFTSHIPLSPSDSPESIYRYDLETEQTTCVSCAPKGVPSSEATLAFEERNHGLRPQVYLARGISEDGDRIFFQTSAALVPRDTNGQTDVYEWTPSGQHLISTGRSGKPSFLIDNSASGDDVFFATAEGLDPEDRDGNYDVYDARVDGGFKQGEQPAPCSGAACQGAGSSAPLIQAPGSLAFSGPGNLTPSGPVKSKPKPLTKAQKLAKALKACHKVKAKRARASCEKKARRDYGPPPRKSKAKARKGGE